MPGIKLFSLTERIAQRDATYRRAEVTVKFLQEQILAIQKQMDELIQKDQAFASNYVLLQSIKGIGPVNAINTILHTNNFTCFDNARKYACYIGIAPFEYTCW